MAKNIIIIGMILCVCSDDIIIYISWKISVIQIELTFTNYT